MKQKIDKNYVRAKAGPAPDKKAMPKSTKKTSTKTRYSLR